MYCKFLCAAAVNRICDELTGVNFDKRSFVTQHCCQLHKTHLNL